MNASTLSVLNTLMLPKTKVDGRTNIVLATRCDLGAAWTMVYCKALPKTILIGFTRFSTRLVFLENFAPTVNHMHRLFDMHGHDGHGLRADRHNLGLFKYFCHQRFCSGLKRLDGARQKAHARCTVLSHLKH